MSACSPHLVRLLVAAAVVICACGFERKGPPAIGGPRKARTIDDYVEAFEKSYARKDIITKGAKHELFDYMCGKVRGLQATMHHKKGSGIVTLPLSESISAREGSGPLGPRAPAGLEPLWSEVPATTRVALLLLLEWQKTKKEFSESRFSSYMKTLPSPGSMGTPIYWPEAYLEKFPYQPLVQSVKIQKQKWTDLHKKAVELEAFQGSGWKLSLDRFMWAMEIVGSRAFKGIGASKSGPTLGSFPIYSVASTALVATAVAVSEISSLGEVIPAVLGTLGVALLTPAVLDAKETSCVLLPAIDSCNHRGTGATCDISYEPTTSSFVMRPMRDIAVGEQITISYGSKNNDDLLQYFGFVEEDCEFDRFVVIDPLKAMRELVDDLPVDIAETRNAGDNNSRALIITKEGTETWSLGALESVLKKKIGGTLDDEGKHMMKTLLQSELRRMEREADSWEALVSALQPSDAAPVDLYYMRCISSVFLREKIKVLRSALSYV